MRELNLLEFGRLLAQLSFDVEAAMHRSIKEACKILEEEAKGAIGTYQYGWTPLADSTKKERDRLGYAADKPGLRDGDMRDSIEHTIEGTREAQVGSNDDNLVWFELGTKTQPPRPVLAEAATRKEEEIVEKTAVHVIKAIVPTKVP